MRSLLQWSAKGGLPIVLLWLAGCTESPFVDEVAPPPTKIAGRVELNGLSNENHGVYVWLEGFNIGTFTDSSGHFEIEFPRELVGTGTLSGIFKLYFFVANYSLVSLDIAVNDDGFVYGFGKLDRLGLLQEPVQLFKILDIQTVVQPRWAVNTYNGPIDVQVTLQAITDTVTVIFPKSVGGLLGGLFFRNEETGQVFIDIPDEGADTREFVDVGPEPVARRGVFQLNGSNFRDLTLPVGDYEVIPFFFIEHQGLPHELLMSLGERVEEADPQYLRIPFKRQGGHFRIIN